MGVRERWGGVSVSEGEERRREREEGWGGLRRGTREEEGW